MRLRTTAADLREARRKLAEVVRFGLKMTPGFFAAGITGEFGTWTLGVARLWVRIAPDLLLTVARSHAERLRRLTVPSGDRMLDTLMNDLRFEQSGDPRSETLVRALYACL